MATTNSLLDMHFHQIATCTCRVICFVHLLIGKIITYLYVKRICNRKKVISLYGNYTVITDYNDFCYCQIALHLNVYCHGNMHTSKTFNYIITYPSSNQTSNNYYYYCTGKAI